MNFTIDQIKDKLSFDLKKNRYEHTIGVSYTAICLAMCYNYDMKKAELAGLLHDCAKNINYSEKENLCLKYNIKLTDYEKKCDSLVHAKLGAYIAKYYYGINDEKILNAIKYHTTGRPNMTMLDKIIYIADYIEPSRVKAKRLDEIRQLAFKNLDLCLVNILKDTLEYLNQTKQTIDLLTKQAYEYYIEKI